MEGVFKKVNGLKTHEYIVMQIKQAIEKGILKYGDKLPTENELANEFGVSRSTVREALLILEFMGLVETKKGSGTEITMPNENEIIDRISDFTGQGNDFILHLCEARIMIEPQAARLAALKAEQKDKDELWRYLEEMRDKIENQLPIKDAAMDFHRLISRSSKNPFLEYMLNSLYNLLINGTKIVFSIPGRTECSLKEHIEIYKAIVAGDGEKAQLLMEEHITKVKELLEKVYSNE